MTRWVVTISKEFPQHWDYARQHAVWDLKVFHRIKAGDLVYYWQGGRSWAGRARAIEDAYPIEAEQVPPGPWDDWPGPPYKGRFRLEVVDAEPRHRPKWAQVTAAVGTKFNPSWYMHFSTPKAEAALASYFHQEDPLRNRWMELLREAGYEASEVDVEAVLRDERKFVERMVAMREGQDRFRDQLLRVYPRCAVTGTDVETVLEAAHIWRYSGMQSNLVPNGIIFRRDIHRLFDTFTLTITTDLTVRVSPELWGTEYAALDGRPLQVVPSDPAARPSPELLAKHHAKCDWLRS